MLKMSLPRKSDFKKHAGERRYEDTWQPPSYLERARCGCPPHSTIQMAQFPRGDQKPLKAHHKFHNLHAQPGKYGFVFLISIFFCTWNMQEILWCLWSQDAPYTRIMKPIAKHFIPQRVRGCGHYPQPNLPTSALLFQYNETLNYCF